MRHRPVTIDRRLLGQDRHARNWLVVAVVAGVLSVFALLGQLFVVAIAIAGVFLDSRSLDDVMPLLAAALVFLLARSGVGALADVAARRSATALVGSMRSDLSGQVLRLGPTWTSHERSGEIASVLSGGLDSLDDYVTQYLPARWLAGIVPLMVLLVVLVLDPPSVLVLLFTGPMLLLLLAVIGGRTAAITGRRFLEMRTLSAFFLDILRGIPTLKMFGRSREQVGNLRRISDDYGNATMDVLRTAFQTSLVLEWGATIAIALVAVEIGLRLIDGGIAFERALAVLLVTPEFFLPFRQLAIRYHIGTAAKTSMTRAFEILDEPAPSAIALDDAAPGPASPLLFEPPHIAFDDVTFTYPSRESPALERVSLELRPGASLALVGRSGAGKSTVANVLLRFIEPDAGTIVVDGRALAGTARPSWRASLAWVPQRPHLFHGSVADNIRLARPGASDAAVEDAARAANAADFIEHLPGRYDAPVGEGGLRLSGGQRQRIAIARAFLRDAPLLVLDEATSYQDEASEMAIADALDRLMLGRTVLVIAHRLRLAQRADQVVVLEAGRVVELGPPASLLQRDGAYQRLYRDQGALGARA
jgi:thiol reductant ABC exporter CydD subunit